MVQLKIFLASLVIFLFFDISSIAQIKGTNADSSALTNQKKQITTPDSSAVYTCPMHPEIAWSKPDKCPKCGMDLVLKKNEQQAKIIYTCSMHPEVMSDKPGKCPKCGMDLVVKGSGSSMGMGCMGMMHGNKSNTWKYIAGGAMMVVMMTVMIIRFL